LKEEYLTTFFVSENIRLCFCGSPERNGNLKIDYIESEQRICGNTRTR
jgi:hypothetical protein